MDEYETWMVVVYPETGVKVTGVIALILKMHLPVSIKETCFGLLVESDHNTVRGLMNMLRRCYSIRDTRICRTTFKRCDVPDRITAEYEPLPWFNRAMSQLISSCRH